MDQRRFPLPLALPRGKLSGIEVKFSTPLIPALMIGTTSSDAIDVGDDKITILMSDFCTCSSKLSMP